MSEQQLPKKMKKKANLMEEDKEKCDKYYSEVKTFIEKNELKMEKNNKNINYLFEYDEKQNLFISDKYEQKIESFGCYNKINKKMFLSFEEAFYLYQIGYIKFKSEIDFNNFDLVNLYLYSYLRRSSKIILVCKILFLMEEMNKKDEEIKDKNKNEEIIGDIDKYYILFENLEDYKRHKIKSILYQHNSEENLNYILFQNIIDNSKRIYNLYLKVNEINFDEFKSEIIICITQGASITFLKINDSIKI